MRPGRYDSAERRAAKRSGREAGCWTYIPAEALEASGWPLDGPPPFYRIWPRPGRRSFVVQLYREK